jgi:hypothetical protein
MLKASKCLALCQETLDHSNKMAEGMLKLVRFLKEIGMFPEIIFWSI